MSATASSSPIAKALPVWRDPAAWMKTADIVAVLLALSLPWSTSLVGILGVVLLITVAPTLELNSFLALLKRPISALPIALFVLALVGTLWSDAAWGARFYAVGPAAETPGAPGSVLSFRALDAWDMGVRGVPRLLHAVDADVLDGVSPS